MKRIARHAVWQRIGRLTAALLAITSCAHSREMSSTIPSAQEPCADGGTVIPRFGEDARTLRIDRALQDWQGLRTSTAQISCGAEPHAPCPAVELGQLELDVQVDVLPMCERPHCFGESSFSPPANCPRAYAVPVQVAARASNGVLDVVFEHQTLWIDTDGAGELSLHVSNPPSLRRGLNIADDHGVHLTIELMSSKDGTLVGQLGASREQLVFFGEGSPMVEVTTLFVSDLRFASSPP